MPTTYPPFPVGVTHYPERTDRASWEPDLDTSGKYHTPNINQPARDFVLV